MVEHLHGKQKVVGSIPIPGRFMHSWDEKKLFFALNIGCCAGF